MKMIGALALAASVLATTEATASENTPRRTEACVQIRLVTDDVIHRIYAEYPMLPAEYDLGLKHREDIPSHEHMLFNTKKGQAVTFSMADIPSGLDLAFFDENLRLAHIVHNAKPLSSEPISAPGNPRVSFVLAMKAGVSKGFELEPQNTLLSVYKSRQCPFSDF